MGSNGGIYSLAGFAYQIKVFFLQILDLEKGAILEYETIDDIALRMTAEQIDEHEDDLLSVLTTTSSKAIQVKKTKVTKYAAKRVVKNWILAEESNEHIKEFVLVTNWENIPEALGNLVDADEVYKEVSRAAGNQSVDAKIKRLGYTETELKQKIADILSRTDIQICEDIDTEIENKFKDFLIGCGVSKATYYIRIKEFLQQITVEILKAIGQGKPYLLSYEKMSQIKNRIITNYTDEKWEPCFSQFKQLKKINMEDLAVIKPREYRQLQTCTALEKADIYRHLLWGEYYANSKRGYYECGMAGVVEDMENTAYDNFCDAKMELRVRKEDNPDNRLIVTKSKSNSKATDEQLRYGVCIELTSDATDEEIQISWKDEE